MQQQLLQVLRHLFIFFKGAIYIGFTFAIGNDLRHQVFHDDLIDTGIVLAVVLAAFALFDPIVEILLLVGLLALVVLVAHGHCSNPTLESGVRACVTTAGEIAFDAIKDVIHRLLALGHHQLPDVIKA
jgi:hypothetical protein